MDSGQRIAQTRRTMEENERHKTCRTLSMFTSIASLILRNSLSTVIFFFYMLILTSMSNADSLQAPRFTTQPSSSSNIVSEGRTKILQCQAQGFPQPNYRWLKDGVALGNFSSDRYYKIQNTRRKDEGSYQCIAKNDVGSIFSEKIDIKVAYMGLFEDLTEKTMSVECGEAAVLEFPDIESYPPPLVTWQSENGKLDYNIKYTITTDYKLVILSVDHSDQKAYRARATNTQLGKEENSAYVRLMVMGDSTADELAPEIIVKPHAMHIIKGHPAADLQCIANARPLHELETLWFKDGILVESTGISFNFNDPWNRTLSLLAANLTHTGKYTCQVRLRSGGFPTVNASADVVVLEKPTFVNNIRLETLGEYGTTISIPCEVIGVPAPNIVWFWNTEKVDTIPGNRFLVVEDGSLEIRKLRMEDSGMFQCLAANEAGESSVSTWLKVKTSGPVMETPPQNITVLDGKDATISCRAVGAPTPNITWSYNDTFLELPGGRLQVLEQGDLLIAAVKESDAGKYTCIRANEAGLVDASGFLTVLVRTQIVQPPVDTRVLLGHTATLQCRVSSDPTVPYKVSWYHNDEIIDTDGVQRISVRPDGTLEIEAVRAADVGDYTCSVNSAGGNETRSARLSVIELPYAPVNVKASRLATVSQRAVNVSWAPGFDGNSPTLKFIVQRREVTDLAPSSPDRRELQRIT